MYVVICKIIRGVSHLKFCRYRQEPPPSSGRYERYMPPPDSPTSTRALGVKSILETAQNWILSRRGSVKGQRRPRYT